MTKDKNNRDILYGEFVNQIHGTKDDLRKLIDDCVKKQDTANRIKALCYKISGTYLRDGLNSCSVYCLYVHYSSYNKKRELLVYNCNK